MRRRHIKVFFDKINKMKPPLLLALLTAQPGAGHAQVQPPQLLRLKDCVRFTLQHHPNSTIYHNNVLIAQEKIREAKSVFLPAVTANTNFDYNIKLQTSIIAAGTLSPTETKLQLGNKYSTGASVEADQTLFDKSKQFDVRSARIDKEISDLTALQENETLVYNTSSAYYQVLAYLETGKLQRENEAQYQQLLAILKLRFEQGVEKKSEYDRTRVSLNNIQADLALNDNNYELALNKLKNAMGLDLNIPITIDDSIDYTTQIVMPAVSSFNTTNLVSYKIDEKNLLIKEIDIKQKNAAFLPTVSAYAKYGANVYGSELSNAFTDWFDYSAIGIKLSVPLFSGFQKRSQLQQSKLNATNQRLTLKLNNDTYNLEYENSGSQLFSSYTSLIKNKENLDLAKQVLEATGVEYREGVATLSTFLDDDYAYKEAQTNYITSLLDFLNAQLSFEKARGTLTTYLTNLK